MDLVKNRIEIPATQNVAQLLERKSSIFLHGGPGKRAQYQGGPVKLKPSDTVRVVGSRGSAKIRSILTSMHGALLEKQIGGFRRWNLDELRLVKRSEKKGPRRDIKAI